MSRYLPSLIAAAVAGLVYALTHLLNLWVFQYFEFSAHISFVYIPAFLRLANVLVLGWFWGAIGTLLGGVLLIVKNGNVFHEVFANVLISSLGGSAALGLFFLTQRRPVNIFLMQDWIALTLYCAIANVTLHHAYWSIFERYQLQDPIQILWMACGDIVGTILGAVTFKVLATGFDWRRRGPDT